MKQAMTPKSGRFAGIRSAVALLCSTKRGVAAVEFAIVGTVLMTATLGFAEIVLLVRAQTLLASAVANMATMIAADQGLVPVTQLTLRDYCGGAQLTMSPYATAGLSMAIASVTQGTGRDWEYDNACPTAATALGAANASTMASPMVTTSGTSVLMIQARYAYTPPINILLPSVVLTQTAFSSPRFGKVNCLGC